MGTLKVYSTVGDIHADGKYDPAEMSRYAVRLGKKSRTTGTKGYKGHGMQVGIPRIPSFPAIAITQFIEDNLSGTVIEVAAKDPRGVGLYSYTLYFERQADYQLFLVSFCHPPEWQDFKLHLREIEDRVRPPLQELTCPHCNHKL